MSGASTATTGELKQCGLTERTLCNHGDPIPLISNVAAGETLSRWASVRGLEFDWCDRVATTPWLYFATVDDALKIGWSRNPLKRMREIRRDFTMVGVPRVVLLVTGCNFFDEKGVLGLAQQIARPFKGNEWFLRCAALDSMVGALRFRAEACFVDNRVAGYAKNSPKRAS